VPVREARDRRGRAVRGSPGLLERDSTLRAIERTLAATRAGSGEALLVEGHAGMGKTRLHEAALDHARALGLRVLRGAGAELEGNISFGVAGQLLSGLLGELEAGEREALLADAPERIRVLAGVAPAGLESGEADDLSLSHALFSLIAATAETSPTLIAIDDLHWSDPASLEFVLYLLNRIDELPVAIVMSLRPSLGESTREILDRVSAHPRVHTERLSPLGENAIAKLTERWMGDRATRALSDACHTATAGNPFYLRELLVALGEEPGLTGEALARRALELAPDAVSRALRVRVGRLGDPAPALARAVAILGEDVPVRHAAALAGISVASAAEAADRLASVEILLAREPLRYVHPLVRHAIERDVPASERASRHLDAARLLYAEDAEPERVAAHLLLGRAEGNEWVVAHLRAAADQARQRGARQSAVRYLERALEEPPSSEQRADVLAELGTAEAALGLDAADTHLNAAAADASDPCRRAELTLARGNALYARGRYLEASRAYDAGLAELGSSPASVVEPELHDELQTGFVAAASQVPSLRAASIERSQELLAKARQGPKTHGQRMLFAQAAWQAGFAGEPSERVALLAEEAWDGGHLLERDSDGVAWSLLIGALTFTGALERSVELAEAVMEDARRRASPLTFATASSCRALPRLWQGRIADALADLELALGARRYGWRQYTRAASATHCLCMIERGEFERAEAALLAEGPLESADDLEDIARFAARGELRLAQGRPQEALEDAAAIRRSLGDQLIASGYTPWRAIAASAWFVLGERERAAELAGALLRQAEQLNVLHECVRALRLRAVCEGDDRGIESLRRAVALVDDAPPRLETIRALLELGAALRRTNRRSEARMPLQQAADMAHAGGATVLQDRARTELAATGARPRREALLSGPGSLTPSERRIAELAASGQTNREISQALFVTPKTVEYHLRNAFRKLAIESRRDLERVLQ
jgi:DNA-binding CsgD family transcriptional regulator